MNKKLGMVLSGGAVRGVAHLGILQAFFDQGLKIDVFAGTSSGAIVAVLIASGKSPEEVKEKLKTIDFSSDINLRLPTKSMFDNHKLFEKMQSLFSKKYFEELETKVYVTCTDLGNGEQVVFSEGEIIPVLRAASAVPVIFKPIKIDGRHLADGGIISNMPTEPLLDKCDYLVGCNVNQVGVEEHLDDLKSILLRTLHLTIWGNIKNNTGHVDLYLEPDNLYQYQLWDTKHIDEIFRSGYDYTVKMLDQASVKSKLNH